MSNNEKDIEELRARIEKLESQMVYLFRNLGISASEAPQLKASARVMDLIAQGDVNGAIRIFREESGASLKDAKIFVESLKGK